MSFTGDLDQLPIIDVIQLIHSTQKSGTLSIKSQKGESQLAFSEGYFVSANHLNSSVRIGQVLIESKLITPALLDKALLEQKTTDIGHKPLIRILIEQGSIKREDAYKGLETLIEMTVVEALTWTSGTFSMDLNYTEICDEYKYFPDILHQEIRLNGQEVLMDALRIYDEKVRDGMLHCIFFSEDSAPSQERSFTENGEMTITADMLGLDALDTLTQKIPDKFILLADRDHAEEHRRVVADELRMLPTNKQDELSSFLIQISRLPTPGKLSSLNGAPSLAVIMFSHDTFMKYALSTICNNRNHVVFTTDDDISLDLFIDQSFLRGHTPILVVDDPVYIGEGYEERTASMLTEKRSKYPLLSILQMSTSPEHQLLQSQSLEEGTEVILPRPSFDDCPDVFVAKMIAFLRSFRSLLDKSFAQPGRAAARKLKESIAVMTPLSDPSRVARELLIFTSGLFERVLILVAGTGELIAEKGIGVTALKSSGPTGPLMFKIPLGQGSVLDDVIEKRRLFFGPCSDQLLKEYLYSVFPAPLSQKILIQPIMMAGKVIALIYADFGQQAPVPTLIEHLEILSRVAGLVLDNSYNLKRIERMTQTHQM